MLIIKYLESITAAIFTRRARASYHQLTSKNRLMIIYADCLVAEPEPEQLVLPNAGQVFLHFFTLMNSSSHS